MTPAADAPQERALTDRVRELEQENERLRKALAPARGAGSPRRGRTVLSIALIAVAGLLIPLSAISAWGRLQLVDEDVFVSSMFAVVDDPRVQNLIVEETMEAFNAQVDLTAITTDVVDGISELGLPPRAEAALRALAAPAADGIENLLRDAVVRVVASEGFSEAGAVVMRSIHRAVAAAATPQPDDLIVLTDAGVGLQLGALVDRVQQRLVDEGLAVASLIPDIDRVVIISDGDGLRALRNGYALIVTLGWWLPLLTLALLGVGIAVARGPGNALLGAGIAVTAGGVVLALGAQVGVAVAAAAAGERGLSSSGVAAIVEHLVEPIQQAGAGLALVGLIAAAFGWLAGGSASAARTRAFVRARNASIRRGMADRGLNTGAFGTWLARHRGAVRIALAVAGIVWLFAIRPLDPGGAVLVTITVLIVAWVLELLQRRPDEQPDAALTPSASDPGVAAP